MSLLRSTLFIDFFIPQTLTTDQDSSFISKEVRDFAESYKIKVLNSSTYYAQANGQAESSNKILIKLIKKKIEENPKRRHDVLSEALWAHQISRHGATKVTPFELVYGQEAVLPVEVNLDAYRLVKQNDLSAVDYHNLMMDNMFCNKLNYLPMCHILQRNRFGPLSEVICSNQYEAMSL